MQPNLAGTSKKEQIPSGICSFLLQVTDGLEPVAEEVSGGHFLQPVQTLVATIILIHRIKMHIESNRGRQKEKSHDSVAFSFCTFHYYLFTFRSSLNTSVTFSDKR